MKPQPAKTTYLQPLLVNLLLVFHTGLAYLNLRAHDVSYGNNISHPELDDIFFFGLTFLMYPAVNFILALLSQGRRALIYSALGVLFTVLVFWLLSIILGGFQKIGG